MINGKASLKLNLLLAGLITLPSQAFAQSESFVIECKVSGHFLGATSETKISNQLIIVSVSSTPTDASVTIEGSGYLNIGVLRDKPTIFNKEQIAFFTIQDTSRMEKLSNVSINRTTGFIDISVITTYLKSKNKLPDMVTVSGFCQKVSNKQKF